MSLKTSPVPRMLSSSSSSSVTESPSIKRTHQETKNGSETSGKCDESTRHENNDIKENMEDSSFDIQEYFFMLHLTSCLTFCIVCFATRILQMKTLLHDFPDTEINYIRVCLIVAVALSSLANFWKVPQVLKRVTQVFGPKLTLFVNGFVCLLISGITAFALETELNIFVFFSFILLLLILFGLHRFIQWCAGMDI
ncbi:hypothetical protein Ahia01_000613200 [Argonauta hians]